MCFLFNFLIFCATLVTNSIFTGRIQNFIETERISNRFIVCKSCNNFFSDFNRQWHGNGKITFWFITEKWRRNNWIVWTGLVFFNIVREKNRQFIDLFDINNKKHNANLLHVRCTYPVIILQKTDFIQCKKYRHSAAYFHSFKICLNIKWHNLHLFLMSKQNS